MTDVDERLLTAAKLREQFAGRLQDGPAAMSLSTVAEEHAGAVGFLESNGMLSGGKFGDLARKQTETAAARRGLEGDAALLAHLVGVTEQDLDASSLVLPIRLLRHLGNNGAPAFVSLAGNPNTGKTNTMLLLAELLKADRPDLLVVANFDSSLTDERVTSAHDLAVTLLEHRDCPKFVAIDEGSTHFDARTYSRDVAQQWTPLAKRFAKIGVEVAAVVGHTGKDLHPEAKRLTTLPVWKTSKKQAEFFDRWPADADRPADQLFAGSLEGLQETTAEYQPDDAAPWAWDLEPELFARDADWPELLEILDQRGPA